MRQQRQLFLFVLFTALILGLASHAAAAGPELQVELEGKVRLADEGEKEWAPLADGEAVAPGGRILYTVRLINTGDAEARRPQAIGPVPVGTVFIDNQDKDEDGVIVAYSIDGGKTFTPKPMMVVTAPDGSTHTVPAPLDRYTTIQWNWDSSLAAGSQQAVSYQVQVR
jgi:uncharacterized repeat protein (TIGR01451 family)